MKNENIGRTMSEGEEPVWVTVLGCGAGFVLLLVMLAV
jgi:hypothetical protein